MRKTVIFAAACLMGLGLASSSAQPSPSLVLDRNIVIVERPDALHLLNAPSPAATASLAIGAEIVGRVRRLVAS